MFRLVEHTGDIGIEVKASSMEEMFSDAIKGLYSIFLDLSNVKCKRTIKIAITGNDLEEILVETLNEFIYLFDVEKMIFVKFRRFKIKENLLEASVCVDYFDKKKHKVLGAGVKAATYHDLKLKIDEKTNTYYARIIVDV